MSHTSKWWAADKGSVHKTVLDYVQEVEREQSGLFDRFYKLAALYDPHGQSEGYDDTLNAWGGTQRRAQVSENVIASNVDTVAAVIAATEVRARFMTDDALWSEQRRARKLEQYAEGLQKRYKVHDEAKQGFKDGALKGSGLVKVTEDDLNDEICVDRVLVDDIIVDERECRGRRQPRQMHQRVFADREALKARFPDHAEAIDKAQTGEGSTLWADCRELEDNEVVAVESWYLPIGKKGTKGYKPGRHTIVIDGADLLDEEWHKTRFPFAVFRWSNRDKGWYGVGLAERIAGHQRTLNKLNWQIDRQLDQHAVPTTYVRMADAQLAVKTTNRAGTIVPVKGDMPQTVIPPAVSGETYQRQDTVKESAYEESGLSRMFANSRKPPGVESGVALREYRDQTTQRFASQEDGFEKFVLDIVWLMLDVAKDMGDRAPVVMRKSKFGPRQLKWSDVDMGEVETQIEAASTISNTPAGRMQTVLEWAQAGVITQDEARRLMRHPDLERAMSLYTAALEDIERCIEEILDGETLVPEPYQNLKMGIWRMQQEYLRVQGAGAPEEVLEALRQWVVQAAGIESMGEQKAAMGAGAAAGQPAQPGASPAAPMAGGAAPVPGPGAPPATTPTPAVAPESMGVVPA